MYACKYLLFITSRIIKWEPEKRTSCKSVFRVYIYVYKSVIRYSFVYFTLKNSKRAFVVFEYGANKSNNRPRTRVPYVHLVVDTRDTRGVLSEFQPETLYSKCNCIRCLQKDIILNLFVKRKPKCGVSLVCVGGKFDLLVREFNSSILNTSYGQIK